MDDEVSTIPNIQWNKNNDKAVTEIMDYLTNSYISFIEAGDPHDKDIFEKLDYTYDRKSQAIQILMKGNF